MLGLGDTGAGFDEEDVGAGAEGEDNHKGEDFELRTAVLGGWR